MRKNVEQKEGKWLQLEQDTKMNEDNGGGREKRRHSSTKEKARRHENDGNDSTLIPEKQNGESKGEGKKSPMKANGEGERASRKAR